MRQNQISDYYSLAMEPNYNLQFAIYNLQLAIGKQFGIVYLEFLLFIGNFEVDNDRGWCNCNMQDVGITSIHIHQDLS